MYGGGGRVKDATGPLAPTARVFRSSFDPPVSAQALARRFHRAEPVAAQGKGRRDEALPKVFGEVKVFIGNRIRGHE